MENLLDVHISDSNKYGMSIFASRNFKKDEVVFIVCGPVIKKPSIYTVPIDFDLYVDPISPGKFLCHSCEPNSGIKNRTEIVAMRNLNKGEEITIDYGMIVNEYNSKKLEQNTVCKCGSANCRGQFGSYKTLPDDLRRKYSGYISDYLTD